MAKKKEIAKNKNAIATTDRPDFLGDKARGQENVGVEDCIIPRLDVIQSLSPQRKSNDPAYIEGAEEGNLFNTVSGELYGNMVNFVPVYFRKEWVIWKSRKGGGGFFGAFNTEKEANAEMVEKGYVGEMDSKGDDMYQVTDTGQHFGLIVKEDGHVEEVVISMSKSKMKVSRQLNTMVKMAGGDRFSRVYAIGSAEDTNQANEAYQNLTVKPLGYVTEQTYRIAEALYEQIAKGAKDVARDKAEAEKETDEY
jgi:hypothetical protein